VSQIRLILIGVAILVIAGGVIYWTVHERHKGAEVCQSNDLKAANAQLEKQALQLAAYQEQLGDANEKLKDARDLLAAAANAPIPRLVCHTAGPGNLSKVPAPSAGNSSPSGTTDEVRGSDFDPSGDLRRLSVGYELRYVIPANDALNRWPK
jgi:hypothetical protein